MNREDFQKFYLEYRRFSADTAYRIVRNKTAAEDISQEVFCYLYRIRERLNSPDEVKIRALVFHVTVNKCKDYCRKPWKKREIKSVEETEEPMDFNSNPEVMFLGTEDKKHLWTVLDRLRDINPQNYDILVKTKILGFSPDDIALEYGISRNNVNNRICRARRWMIKELKKLRR